MKRLILLAVVPLLLASAARAEDELAYVIKVTPTLAYLDVGQTTGAMVGETYLILREDGKRYRAVGQVQLVRVDANFSIGEIVDIVEGEAIEVLHRAVLRSAWEAMGAMGDGPMQKSSGSSLVGRRSFHVLAGTDWGGEADVSYFIDANRQYALKRPADADDGWSVGLRLGQVLVEQWRFHITYRLGLGKEVTQMAIEGDLHWVPRGYDRAGFYFGTGAGMHQLSWDVDRNIIDLNGRAIANTAGIQKPETGANKVGFNVVAGIQVPQALNLVLEVGYQHVFKVGDAIDVSNVRAFLGFGNHF